MNLDWNNFTGTLPESIALLSPAPVRISLTSTNLVGNLDMFCNKTPDTTNVIADCGGPSPSIDCSCCAICRDDENQFSVDYELECQIASASFVDESGFYYEEGAGTTCGCYVAGPKTRLWCSDPNCEVCNEQGTVCATQSFTAKYMGSGIPLYYKTQFQYVSGIDALVTFEREFDGDELIFKCTVTVNGEHCNSCNERLCSPDGVRGFDINCDNVDGVGSYSPCQDEILNNPESPLAVFAKQNSYNGDGCKQRILSMI